MMQKLACRKALAMFVLAFLCLNVGGALCLSYCTQFTLTASVNADDSHLSEHCRKAKKAAEEKNQNSSITANSAACCMLPMGLFAAPVEKLNRFSVVVAEVNTPSVPIEFTAPVLAGFDAPAVPVYRPPPLDRRVERVLHCVIRI